jgi:hypothetical protein
MLVNILKMNKILKECGIIDDLTNIIIKYVVIDHILLSNTKNKQKINFEELIKYDGKLMVCFIKQKKLDEINHSVICGKYRLYNNIKWLHKNKYLISNFISCYVGGDGDIKMLEWLRKIDKIDKRTYLFAAEKGKLNVIKWLVKNKYERNYYTFAFAAKNGNIENMKWLLENNFQYDKLVYYNAFINGNKEAMKWLLENNFPCSDIIKNNLN